MGRALLFGDADFPRRALWDKALAKADLVVAADGGANRALDIGIDVDWVVGDLDGILPSSLERIPASKVKRDTDPAHTDLEKALAFCSKRRVKEATLVGFLGGRLDHTMGTLAAMLAWQPRIRLRAIDDLFETSVCGGRMEFRAPVGTMVSLLAPNGARGVTTSGLRFALRDDDLPFSPIGIHNEVARNPVRIRVRSGSLLLMRSHVPMPHD